LRSIGAGIRVIDAGLVDAPLRLGIKLDEICTGAAHKLIKQEEIVIARTLIERYAKASLVVAPLALGDHVDHLVVHRAAVAAASANRFGFYEDLPYGTWTRESEMISRVQQTANQLRTPLRPNLMKVEHAVRRKERHVLNYQSQITSLEGKSIARFSARYSGERVWVPARTRRWTWL
jgi:LmbE family N-acetylglucosaminyl deacetylase